ncbi:MAG: Rpn family recombination-promoting nuclease/putative transposase [Bacteroidia bacterium]
MKRPHDAYFKKTFGNKVLTRDFLRHFLDSTAIQTLDLDTLELFDTSYIDGKLNEHFSDIVFTCKRSDSQSDENVFVSILLEHKSYTDPFVKLQLLRYLVNIWEEQRKSSDIGSLSPIIPIVIYHGEENWEQKPFSTLFHDTNGALGAFIPDFEYIFSNLNHWDDNDIAELQVGLIQNAVLALKHSRSPDGLIQNIFGILDITNTRLPQELSIDFVRVTFQYLLHVSQSNIDIIMNAIDQMPVAHPEGLTMAEQLLQKGIEKNKIETALKAKELALDIDSVIQLTGLTKEAIIRIWEEH